MPLSTGAVQRGDNLDVSLMKNPTKITCAIALIALTTSSSIRAAEPSVEELRTGKNFIPTQVYSAEEDAGILKAFEGLRVADVVDGLDAAGLFGRGLMDREIRPVWTDTKDYSHRIIGIAVTARFVPTQEPAPGKMSEAEYDAWAGKWYNEKSKEHFVPLLRPGSVIVLEDAPNADVGSIGSANIMGWKAKGSVGVITNAGTRDSDEIATEKMPIYTRFITRGIRPGRNEMESVNRPVVVGGALVKPGDVIVADGDGVIVVPRAYAEKVAAYAHKILEGDKNARRGLYQQLGLPPDKSVK
jgi:4-hydroxy-4-methyl-2-oxoglutarate aldolase